MHLFPEITPALCEKIRLNLLRFAEERGVEQTFCPSEVARAIMSDWRPLLPAVKEVAAHLVDSGTLRCTQRGRTVHPATARGAIRLSQAEVRAMENAPQN